MIMRILLTAGVICLTSATGGDVRSVNAGTAGVEPRDLLGVLEKGYASAKSVLSDVRIVYAEEMSTPEVRYILETGRVDVEAPVEPR